MNCDKLKDLDSGFDIFPIHLVKALFEQMRGQPDVAMEHLSKAATRGVMPVEGLTRMYETAGWDEMPKFSDLRNTHREYISVERDKLLNVACGPDGFEAWQPSPTACGKSPIPN